MRIRLRGIKLWLRGLNRHIGFRFQQQRTCKPLRQQEQQRLVDRRQTYTRHSGAVLRGGGGTGHDGVLGEASRLCAKTRHSAVQLFKPRVGAAWCPSRIAPVACFCREALSGYVLILVSS